MTNTTPLITGVDFVCIPAQDFDAMTSFYGETLGLPFVKRYGSRPGAEYQAGNLTLAIMRTEDFGGSFSPNAMPIALQVDDVAVARERLEAKGVRFVSDTFDSGVCWQAICLDPDGNPLSLHHRYAPKDERPDASRVSATGGSHPRTTRRPTVSGPRSSRCPSSLTRAARIPIGSRTHSRRCGPGSPKTLATPIACCERSWPRCSGAIQIR